MMTDEIAEIRQHIEALKDVRSLAVQHRTFLLARWYSDEIKELQRELRAAEREAFTDV